MSITVDREEFLSALQAASPGLSPKDIHEQSSCFAFLKDAIWTFNGEVACRVPFKLNGIEGAVSGAKLMAPLALMQEESLELSAEDGQLLITGAGQSVGLAMEAEVLLPVARMEKPSGWVKVCNEYSEALAMACECAGSDKEKFATYCVHFHPEWVEAFDMRQLLRFNMETGVNASTLVKRDGVKCLAEFGVSEVAESESWLHFKNPAKHVISCRRFIEEFVDLSGDLEVEGEPITLPKGLIQCTELAELFSSEDIDNNFAKVQIKPGKIRIQARGVSGSYKAVRDMAYTGKAMEFFIAPKLLKQIVLKYNDAVVSRNRLMVDGGKWKYVAVLAVMEEE